LFSYLLCFVFSEKRFKKVRLRRLPIDPKVLQDNEKQLFIKQARTPFSIQFPI